jgi:hypothetical protein
VRLTLGSNEFDVTHRAVVIAMTNAADGLADGADAVDLSDVVVVAPAEAARSGDAGSRIVVDVSSVDDLAAWGELATRCPVMVTAESAAEFALAITRGARVLRTQHVRVARRVADVMAATLEARVGS